MNWATSRAPSIAWPMAYQTLLTAERRLLQDVSHELRSPLARLRFAAELAKSSPDPQAAIARVNKEINRQLPTLVGELLQVTRAEGDPEARNVSAIDLAEFLKSIVEAGRSGGGERLQNRLACYGSHRLEWRQGTAASRGRERAAQRDP